MSEEPTPSAGAVRAAAALFAGDWYSEPEAAAIIDRETGAGELRAMLERVLAPYDSGGNFGGDEWGHRRGTIKEARELLAKFKP